MDKGAIKIMVLDDEVSLLGIVSRVLSHQGYQVFSANSSDEGLEIYEREKPAICVLDLALHNSEINGLDVLQVIRQKKNDDDMICVILTCYAEDEDIKLSNELGVFSCLMKPLRSKELVRTVEQAAELVQRRTLS